MDQITKWSEPRLTQTIIGRLILVQSIIGGSTAVCIMCIYVLHNALPSLLAVKICIHNTNNCIYATKAFQET